MTAKIYDVNNRVLTSKSKKPTRYEVGGTGRAYAQRFQQYLATDEYLSALRFPYDVTVYEKMGRSDGQIKAILLMLSLPVRATQWFIRPKDSSRKAKKIANYIEQCLFGGYDVGLNNGFDDFIKDVTTMYQFGHSIFEKVFEVKKQQIKWKKFAVRPQSTIYDIYYDRVGDCKGIEQYMIKENWETVYIPIEKLLIFSHDMQQANVRGTSVLRSAYKHWSIKDFLYKITNIGIERNFAGTPVLTLPENYTQDDKDLADEIVTTLRSNEFGGVRIPNGFMLEMFEGKRTLADVMPYINHQDESIAKSILAQFMNLGSSGGTSGSYALSSDQSQMFLMMLDSSAKNICNTINTHAIPELVKYNFNSDLYPSLSFKPMNSTKLVNTLKTLVDGKLVLPDDDLETYLRDMLDLPESNPAQTREEAIEQFKNNQLSIQQNKENNINKTNQTKTPIESGSKQKQYTSNNKIKEDNVNKKMNEFDKLSNDNIDDLKKIIEKQFINLKEKADNTDINNLSGIKIQYKGELNKLIKQILVDSIKLKESDITFVAKTNILSNNISEKVKSIFLSEYINNSEIEIDDLMNKFLKIFRIFFEKL